MAITDYAIPASALRDAFRAQGVDAVTTVPDFVQFALHHAMKSDEAVRYIECSAENQALTTAMGLYVGGRSPMVMMQNQGLLNCLNTLRSGWAMARPSPIPDAPPISGTLEIFNGLGEMAEIIGIADMVCTMIVFSPRIFEMTKQASMT